MNRTNLSNIFIALCLTLLVGINWMPAALALGGNQPVLGKAAPEFTLPYHDPQGKPTNTGDREISLSDYRGKWVVLYFYPEGLYFWLHHRSSSLSDRLAKISS